MTITLREAILDGSDAGFGIANVGSKVNDAFAGGLGEGTGGRFEEGLAPANDYSGGDTMEEKLFCDCVAYSRATASDEGDFTGEAVGGEWRWLLRCRHGQELCAYYLVTNCHFCVSILITDNHYSFSTRVRPGNL